MNNQEFKEKYGFEKPEDSRERDMIIMSNLSDIQIEIDFLSLETGGLSPDIIVKKINTLKQFMIDSR